MRNKDNRNEWINGLHKRDDEQKVIEMKREMFFIKGMKNKADRKEE
ncbi:hypothetical protein M3676_25505 [Metabacillus litoralis]|nr:hypothetical protein [Metabacillus litoralis]